MWLPWKSQEKTARNLAINFANRSRSYDANRRTIRFWRYDLSRESTFFVTVDALNRIQPNLRFKAIEFLPAGLARNFSADWPPVVLAVRVAARLD